MSGGGIFPLTWVCSEWRQIILSTPSFWTSYQFQEIVLSSNNEAYISMIDCLNELLLRSGTDAPLRFHLDFGSDSGDRAYAVLDPLIQHTSRWKEVSLVFKNSHRQKSFRSALQHIQERSTSFPNLELLSMSIMGEHVFKLGFFGKTFIHCPHLHYLDVASFHIREVVDLQHLTILKIGVCIGASLALLLQRFPVLETLCVSCLKPDHVPDSLDIVPIPSNVHHPHLKHLTVKDLGKYAMSFWGNVSLPNLTRVYVGTFIGGDDKSRFGEFKRMLVDSQCVLEKLDLSWDRDPQSSIESLVEGIRLSPKSHTHCRYTQSDGPCAVFKAVPSYQKRCYDCMY